MSRRIAFFVLGLIAASSALACRVNSDCGSNGSCVRANPSDTYGQCVATQQDDSPGNTAPPTGETSPNDPRTPVTVPDADGGRPTGSGVSTAPGSGKHPSPASVQQPGRTNDGVVAPLPSNITDMLESDNVPMGVPPMRRSPPDDSGRWERLNELMKVPEPIYAAQPQPGQTETDSDEGETWLEITGVDDLDRYDVVPNGALERMHLDNAASIIDRFERAEREPDALSPVFVLRLRPLEGSPTSVNWLAMGGTQQLLNIYMGYGSDPGMCLMQLFPPALDLVACCPPGGGGDNGNGDVDGKKGDDGKKKDDDGKKKGDDGKKKGDDKKKDDDDEGDDDEAPSLDGDDDDDDGEAPSLDDPDKPQLPEIPIIIDPYSGIRCGTISTIRSLLKMKWITAKDAVDGDKLKPDYVKGFDKYLGEKGMSPPNEEKAHSDHAPKGKKFKKKDFDINHLMGAKDNKKSWDEVDKLLKKGWDCIISYIVTFKKEDGTKGTVGHGEMISEVTRSGDQVSVDMEDALDQGTGSGKGIKSKGDKTTKKYNDKHREKNGKSTSPISIQCYGVE